MKTRTSIMGKRISLVPPSKPSTNVVVDNCCRILSRTCKTSLSHIVIMIRGRKHVGICSSHTTKHTKKQNAQEPKHKKIKRQMKKSLCLFRRPSVLATSVLYFFLSPSVVVGNHTAEVTGKSILYTRYTFVRNTSCVLSRQGITNPNVALSAKARPLVGTPSPCVNCKPLLGTPYPCMNFTKKRLSVHLYYTNHLFAVG